MSVEIKTFLNPLPMSVVQVPVHWCVTGKKMDHQRVFRNYVMDQVLPSKMHLKYKSLRNCDGPGVLNIMQDIIDTQKNSLENKQGIYWELEDINRSAMHSLGLSDELENVLNNAIEARCYFILVLNDVPTFAPDLVLPLIKYAYCLDGEYDMMCIARMISQFCKIPALVACNPRKFMPEMLQFINSHQHEKYSTLIFHTNINNQSQIFQYNLPVNKYHIE